jgi:soluble lytic murein transglycosylase-like protein
LEVRPREGAAPFDAVIQQESGGRPGVVGPQTQYGRALGMTQMLPATAREMAGKVGVAWQPSLMTGTTPEAAQYQRTLGEAYFSQALQATGNLPDALRYYHGGPSRSQWGPKTEQYARSVLSRLGKNS